MLVTAATMLGVYAIVTRPSTAGARRTRSASAAGAGAARRRSCCSRRASRTRSCRCAILRIRSLMARASSAAASSPACSASFFLGALYLEHVLGYGALADRPRVPADDADGAALSLGITARLMARFGPLRTLLAGLGLIAVARSCCSPSAGTAAAYFPTCSCPFLLLGLGVGLAFLPLLHIAMADVPARDAGLASGIVNVSLWISSALGLAVLGTLATDHTQPSRPTAKAHRRR